MSMLSVPLVRFDYTYSFGFNSRLSPDFRFQQPHVLAATGIHLALKRHVSGFGRYMRIG